jgi:hypothetical protein
VTLPTALKTDGATATFENGLLKLSFPKAEEAKPRQIEIKPVTEGQMAQVEGSTDHPGDQAGAQPNSDQAS